MIISPFRASTRHFQFLIAALLFVYSDVSTLSALVSSKIGRHVLCLWNRPVSVAVGYQVPVRPPLLETWAVYGEGERVAFRGSSTLWVKEDQASPRARVVVSLSIQYSLRFVTDLSIDPLQRNSISLNTPHTVSTRLGFDA